MLIHSASQVVTLAGGPQSGERFGQLGMIENGAVYFEGNKILETGPSDNLLTKYKDAPKFNADGRAVIPGFVDPHTHLVWAGNRADEFEMRLQGKSYMEIMKAGGGIQSTVNATRKASRDALYKQSSKRAIEAFRAGTTTMEAKSGYGLEIDTELKQVGVALEVDKNTPLEIIPTFLGAHAIPTKYRDDPDGYVEEICNEMLPAVKVWWGENTKHVQLPFVDVFCEQGAFSVAQSRKVLETARKMGFPLKIHADEFANIGGASLAAELGAISADHLVTTSGEDITALAKAGTVAVSLPCTPFGLAEKDYSPAQAMIDGGCIFALASDLNPGTAWCGNMQFVMALACRYMGLAPAQALAAATINAAAAIGLHSRIGSIEKGKQADMLILSVGDYRQMAYRFGTNLVDCVVKHGRLFSQEELCSL